MKCCTCRCEMEFGYISVYKQFLSWIPEGEKPTFLAGRAPKNGVNLGKYTFPVGTKTNAFCCRTCRTILIEY